MSDASDASDGDDIESIKQRKAEELTEQAADISTNDEPIHVDGKSHLSDLVTDNDVVLVDFYADWCGPCQMLEPTVEQVAEETAATVAKVDVDAHQALAREYSVQGIPTLFLFADGEVAERLVGMQDAQTLFDLVEQYT